MNSRYKINALNDANTQWRRENQQLREERDRLKKENGKLKEKADMIDTILNCKRIRVLGTARGGSDGKQGKIRHIGLELWTEFSDVDDSKSRETLLEFLKQLDDAYDKTKNSSTPPFKINQRFG